MEVGDSQLRGNFNINDSATRRQVLQVREEAIAAPSLLNNTQVNESGRWGMDLGQDSKEASGQDGDRASERGNCMHCRLYCS